MPPPTSLSALSRAELESLLVDLFGEVSGLKQLVSEQRDEIARLKGQKTRPTIKPSGMEKATEPANPASVSSASVAARFSPRLPLRTRSSRSRSRKARFSRVIKTTWCRI